MTTAHSGVLVTRLMMPLTASRLTISPELKVSVAPVTPTRQGRPYSLATTAPCEMRPPSSVTTPASTGKCGDQPMSVLMVTRISPGWMVSASEMCVTTRAGPVTLPGHAGVPDTLISLPRLDPASVLPADACCSFFSI